MNTPVTPDRRHGEGIVKRLAFLLIASLLFGAVPNATAQEAYGSNINLLIGGRALDQGDWAPLEEQAVVGVEYDVTGPGWPVGIFIGLSGSSAFEERFVSQGRNVYQVDLEGNTFEISGGVRKYFAVNELLHPYVNAGVAIIRYELSAYGGPVDETVDDTTFGGLVGAGVVYRVGGFNIGLDLRTVLGTSLEIDGVAYNGDYWQSALFFGLHF